MSIIKQLAIFDLDGTLVDSFEQIGSNLDKARVDLGFKPRSLAFYKQMVGLPVHRLISDLNLADGDLGELISLFRTYLIEDIRRGNNALYPGVLETLALLVNWNVGLSIATSKPTKIATEVVSFSSLSRFEFYVQGTDDFPPKPNPEVILRVLSRFPKVPSFMIGDRVEDVFAARSAGIPVIGIAAGAHSEKRLRVSGASLTFGSFEVFYEALVGNSEILKTFPFSQDASPPT